MAEFIVRDSVKDDALLLGEKLRDDDRFEITCTGTNIKKALWRSYRRSLVRRTALIDGEIAVMGGCSGSAFSGVGELWLLTTPMVERMPVSFVKHARKELVRTLMIFPRVHGIVSPSYKRACGFLRLLGFELSEPRPIKPGGPMFQTFSMGF